MEKPGYQIGKNKTAVPWGVATWVFGLNAPALMDSTLLNKKRKISKNGRKFFLLNPEDCGVPR